MKQMVMSCLIRVFCDEPNGSFARPHELVLRFAKKPSVETIVDSLCEVETEIACWHVSTPCWKLHSFQLNDLHIAKDQFPFVSS